MRKQATVPEVAAPASIETLIAQRDEHKRLAAEIQEVINKLCLPRMDGLSPRQCEVVELVRLGLMNKEIAYKLCVTLSTVKFHVRNIMLKRGCHYRRQL